MRGRDVLLVTPCWPATTGYGLAMRAGALLAALAEIHAVDLLVVPVAGPATPPAAAEPAIARARKSAVLDLSGALDPLYALSARVQGSVERSRALAAYPRPAACRFATSPARGAAARALAGDHGLVVVLRTYLLPYLETRLAASPCALWVDADDDEVATRADLAALHARRGEHEAARFEIREAEKFAALEARGLATADWVTAAGPADVSELAGRIGGRARFSLWPNVVAVPPGDARSAADRPAEPTLLFVGNLSYLPNEEAAAIAALEVLPRLRREMPRARLRLVGSQPGSRVRALARAPGVELVANPATVAEIYPRATCLVAPLVAGGGTRIKLLEAFAHGLPVVSSRVGARGLEVIDGHHLLLADDPDELARACLRLIRDPALADSLVANARALVATRYSPAALGPLLRDLLAGPPSPAAEAGSSGD